MKINLIIMAGLHNTNNDILNSKFGEELGKAIHNSLPKILNMLGKERVKKVQHKMEEYDIHLWYESYFK